MRNFGYALRLATDKSLNQGSPGLPSAKKTGFFFCMDYSYSPGSKDLIHTPAILPPLPVATRFKLECVIVCANYGDFLVQTLPLNKQLFDRIVIVTSKEDLETKRVCEFHHVECVRTDVLRTLEGKFCKGAGINAGLARLDMDGWLVHMDADIYLPPQTRILLERAELNPAMIYGCDRFNVKGYAAWDDFRSMPVLQQENDTFIHMKSFPIGARFMHGWAGGYVPIGFFQLWHPGTSGIRDYPAEHTNAGRGDTLHAMRWPRSHRGSLPEIVTYHLESDDSKMAANWSGRTTAPFRRAIVKKSRGQLPSHLSAH